jgi:hypothetical protein
MPINSRDFNNIETRADIKYFPANEIVERNSLHSDKTLGKYTPSNATFKNWVAQFHRDDFSTCVAPRPG